MHEQSEYIIGDHDLYYSTSSENAEIKRYSTLPH